MKTGTIKEIDYLTVFMEDNQARISFQNKWIVRDDNLWFVYGHKPYKKVVKIIETESFLEALDYLKMDY